MPLDRSLPSYPANSIPIYHVPRFTTKSSLVTWFPSFISIFLSFLLIFLLFLLSTTKSRDSYLLRTPIVLFLLYILSPISVVPLAIKAHVKYGVLQQIQERFPHHISGCTLCFRLLFDPFSGFFGLVQAKKADKSEAKKPGRFRHK